MNKRQGWFVAINLIGAYLWINPVTSQFLLPLIYLNTHLHELGHALAAIGTGGRVEAIYVYGNGGGVTPIIGGLLPLIAMAGYVGAALMGGAMLAWSTKQKSAERTAIALAITLVVSLLVFVRGDWIGIASAIGWALVLALLGLIKDRRALPYVISFLGFQQCITSLQSFAALYGANLVSNHSDAEIMERTTGISSLFWSTLWLILSLGGIAIGGRAAWKSLGQSNSS